MTAQFDDITGPDKQKIYSLINGLDNITTLNPDKVKLSSQLLSFTRGWFLILAEDYSFSPHQIQYFLYDGRVIYPTHYSHDPHSNNHICDMVLDLNQHNIGSYIGFYYQFFIKDNERIKIIRHVDDIEFQDDISPSIRQSLERDLTHYPKITAENNGFLVKIPIIFHQSIMIIDFFVTELGFIEIQQRQSLIDDLPIKNFS